MKNQFGADNKLPEQGEINQDIPQQVGIQHLQTDKFWTKVFSITRRVALPLSLMECVIGIFLFLSTFLGAWVLDGECSFLYDLGLYISILNPLFIIFFLFMSRKFFKVGIYSIAKAVDFVLLIFLLVPVYAIARWEYLDFKLICGF